MLFVDCGADSKSHQVHDLTFTINKEEGKVKASKEALQRMVNSATASDFDVRNEQRDLERRKQEVSPVVDKWSAFCLVQACIS